MKKVVKSGLKKLFKKVGLEIIPTWRLPDLNFIYHLQELFSYLDIRCVLDVGAHRGEYRNLLRNKVGFDGLIISFEPIRENVSILNERAENDSSWVIQPFALGSCNMQLPIHVMKSSTFSSFLTPNSGVTDMGEGNSVQRVEICEIKSLDSVATLLKSEYQARNIFLKLDTQGYDLEVVRGADNILSEILALQTELSFMQIYQDMPDYHTVIQELQKRGFDITFLEPLHRDHLLRVAEFDCVMINRLLAQKLLRKE